LRETTAQGPRLKSAPDDLRCRPPVDYGFEVGRRWERPGTGGAGGVSAVALVMQLFVLLGPLIALLLLDAHLPDRFLLVLIVVGRVAARMSFETRISIEIPVKGGCVLRCLQSSSNS
jgi:hypothetical protein